MTTRTVKLNNRQQMYINYKIYTTVKSNKTHDIMETIDRLGHIPVSVLLVAKVEERLFEFLRPRRKSLNSLSRRL